MLSWTRQLHQNPPWSELKHWTVPKLQPRTMESAPLELSSGEWAWQGSQVTEYALKGITSISHIRTSPAGQLSHIFLISTLSVKRHPNGLAHIFTPACITGCYKPINWLLWGQMSGPTLLAEDQGTIVLFEIHLLTKLDLSLKRLLKEKPHH